jgi:hypothetical protein
LFSGTEDFFWNTKAKRELNTIEKGIDLMYFLINAIDSFERIKANDLHEMQHASR